MVRTKAMHNHIVFVGAPFRYSQAAGSGTIAKLGYAFLLGAMITTKVGTILLQAMTDNADAACRTGWCERMDCAFKTVVGVGLPVLDHLKCLIVIIAARFAFGHGIHHWFVAKSPIQTKLRARLINCGLAR